MSGERRSDNTVTVTSEGPLLLISYCQEPICKQDIKQDIKQTTSHLLGK